MNLIITRCQRVTNYWLLDKGQGCKKLQNILKYQPKEKEDWEDL